MRLSSRRLIAGTFLAAAFAGTSARAATERVVYSFQGGSDGAAPAAPLVAVGGTLYGTTTVGGACQAYRRQGCGTVFSVTPAGAETVLYAFQARSDGWYPTTGLTIANGTLYGTTRYGGVGVGYGTVFTISPSGTYQQVLRLTQALGPYPDGELLQVGRALYGVSDGEPNSGSPTQGGSVYEVTPLGGARLVHAFGTPADGSLPHGALLDIEGLLYGTTRLGGNGQGTIFQLTRSGTETTLYTFQGGVDADGSFANGGLVGIRGVLYGTASDGGGGGDFGTVFDFTPGTGERVLHRFKQKVPGGYQPGAPLTQVGSLFYGTTISGGAFNGGTVYSVTKGGHLTTLYSFQGGSDGAGPMGRLLYLDGTLYGTTRSGGAADLGTVFAITP